MSDSDFAPLDGKRRHKVAELEGALLDAAVARIEGAYEKNGAPGAFSEAQIVSAFFGYSRDWALGGPIIERERILLIPCIEPNGKPVWSAHVLGSEGQRTDRYMEYGKQGDDLPSSPLTAAMRAFVASKLGPEVDL